ncbi:hypothetical protein [Streptomyces syringium]|uniref:hypothetical protein n=1 Tax=Streptomyces syringium TaxID=76729 RepID=UPI0033E0610D
MIGEHGDRAVVFASATRAGGLPVAVPVWRVREELSDRPRRISAGLGRTRCGPAGAVIAALRAGLGLEDRVVELSVNHEERWRGIPLRFAAGTPTVCLPLLDTAEARQLVAADAKLRDGYEPVARLHVPVCPSRTEKTAVTRTATRIATAAQAAVVTSNSTVVTEWALRYFGPWWNATSTTADDCPQVIADINPDKVTEIAQRVVDDSDEETVYANSAMILARDDDGTVFASQPDDKTAYRAEPRGPLHIYGCEDVPVALATARLAREVVRGRLLADGWSILHASAIVRDGKTVLTLGDKGAGKTTTALLLARAGWQLLWPTTGSSSAPKATGCGFCPGPRPPPWVSVSSTPSAGTTRSATASSVANSFTPPSTGRSPTPSTPAAAHPCGVRPARSSSHSSSPTSSLTGSA